MDHPSRSVENVSVESYEDLSSRSFRGTLANGLKTILVVVYQGQWLVFTLVLRICLRLN